VDSAWLFNLGADIYAWFTDQPTWRGSCARMAELLEPIQPSIVLDLGCGPGVSTFELERNLPGARVIGVDVALRMLRQARRRQRSFKHQVQWLRADASRLPVRSQSVDACTGHSFLYLVNNRSQVLREIRRVLRRGGRLVLMEPHARPATLSAVLNGSHDPRHLVSVSLWRAFSRLHGRFTAESLKQTLQAAGFEAVTVAETLGGLGLLACATAP
jgi:ubiquinone/menaquinone biosynthesis C-methylase UbiE